MDAAWTAKFHSVLLRVKGSFLGGRIDFSDDAALHVCACVQSNSIIVMYGEVKSLTVSTIHPSSMCGALMGNKVTGPFFFEGNMAAADFSFLWRTLLGVMLLQGQFSSQMVHDSLVRSCWCLSGRGLS